MYSNILNSMSGSIFMSKIPNISDAEWIVMEIIWKKKKVTANEIIDNIKNKKTWNHRTVKTLLNRLLKKKIIKFAKKGRTYHYSAIIKKTDCQYDKSHTFLNNFFGGSLSPMIAALVTKKKLTDSEIKELKNILDLKKTDKK